MQVNILGTEYRIKYVSQIDGRAGETDFYTKIITISNQEDIPKEFKTNNLEKMQEQVLRHEIIHAFLFESGLDMNSNPHECWANNEEMIDWFAIQMPKIMEAYNEVMNKPTPRYIEGSYIDGRKIKNKS